MSGARAVFVLAMKDIRLLVRDKPGFFFTFFWPLAMAIFFGVIFSGSALDEPAKIGIAVVDEDATPQSRAFAELLRAAPEFDAQSVETREAAVDAVRRGRRVASIAITKGYGEASERLFFGEPARLEVVVDPSRGPESAMLQGLLQRYGYERLQGLFGGDPEMSRRLARKALDSLNEGEGASPQTRAVLEPFLKSLDEFSSRLPDLPKEQDGKAAKGGGFQPLVIESTTIQRRKAAGPSNAFEVSFPQGVLWGLIGACASFALSLVVERTRGTLVRLRMSPLGRARILAGKALACFLLTLAVSTILLLIAAFGFHVTPTSVPLLIAGVLCSCAAFVGLMMLISTLGRTEAAASGVAWAVLLIFAMVGGGMVPRIAMPPWMLQAGMISPASWTIRALEGALWRDWSFAELAPVYAVLLAIGVVCFVLGVRFFRWED